MKTLAIEGLCKLLVCDKLEDANHYITALLLLWFDPKYLKIKN